MKVLELLDELDEIIEVASSVPVVRKVMVDPNEVREIVKEIRLELPDEIQQAQWIKNERQRILDEAKAEYESILNEARQKADALVENDEITVKAKARADEILRIAQENSQVMKMSILDYTDSMLYNLQEKVDQMYATYFTDMYDDLQATFEKINANIASSRSEVKEQIYKSQVEKTQ
ncbi:MAG: ATPase [Firmicutes bacterium]|jgi:vacuolar-type H+-ATPase subunit H|nr:ATPase [Bacillota bacterium]MBR0517469.1 ATPase [Bacillota bacterium]MBR2099502.1 ATPase [Bacillota bacterium]MBR3749900.1 ATPase [Bacillota bacterium]MBR4142954.1 ATPase [Bacillota bacterium]